MSSPPESPPLNPTSIYPPSNRSAALNASSVEQARAIALRSSSNHSTPHSHSRHDLPQLSPSSVPSFRFSPLPDLIEPPVSASSVTQLEVQSGPSSPSLSQTVSPPSYADRYYHGIPSCPRLIAGSRTDLRFSLGGAGDVRTKTSTHPFRKRLHAVESTSPLAVLWEHCIAPELIRMFHDHSVKVECVDVVGFSMDAGEWVNVIEEIITVIWIGVNPDTLSWQNATRLVAECDEMLAKHDLKEVDVEIRECYISRNVANLRDPRAYRVEFAKIVNPFTNAIGFPISLADSPERFGTAGVFLQDRQDSSQLYLLTTQHVLAAARDAELRPPSGNGSVVSVRLNDSWQADFTTKVGDLQESKRWISLVQAGDERNAGNLVEAERIKAKSDESIESLGKIAEAICNEWRDPENRTLGIVHAYPKRHVSDEPGHEYTNDWGLVSMFTSESLDYHRNVLSLRDVTDLDEVREDPTTEPRFSYPDDLLLPITAISSRDDVESKLAVVKNGATTGLTFGHLNGIRSIVRDEEADGVYSREICVISASGAFSSAGDSGAAIVDRSGRFVGILSAGSTSYDVRSNDPRTVKDVTYATPAWWILERIAEFGMDLRVLGVPD